MKKSKKVSARGATGKSATKKSRKSTGFAISTSAPLGMLALHLREQWKKSGRDGLVFLAEDENRAERLGGIVHALDPSLDVLVFPRLNTLPFDGLEPSREIAEPENFLPFLVGLFLIARLASAFLLFFTRFPSSFKNLATANRQQN